MVRRDTSTILLAEDDENDVVMFRRAARHVNLGNPLVVVSDGNEVMACLAGEGKYADRRQYPLPGLLLLDLKMPGRDGFEVLQWLRGRSELSHLEVVVLSSSEAIRDINRAYEFGANSFLVKPRSFEEYIGMVEAIHSYCLRVGQTRDRMCRNGASAGRVPRPMRSGGLADSALPAARSSHLSGAKAGRSASTGRKISSIAEL
jgi:CheY-like chemotaxis protein